MGVLKELRENATVENATVFLEAILEAQVPRTDLVLERAVRSLHEVGPEEVSALVRRLDETGAWRAPLEVLQGWLESGEEPEADTGLARCARCGVVRPLHRPVRWKRTSRGLWLCPRCRSR